MGNEEMESRLADACKNESELNNQVAELGANLQEERSQKQRQAARNRQLQEEIARLEHACEDECAAKDQLQRNYDLFKAGADEQKRKTDDLQQMVEDYETQLTKSKRGNND